MMMMVMAIIFVFVCSVYFVVVNKFDYSYFSCIIVVEVCFDNMKVVIWVFFDFFSDWIEKFCNCCFVLQIVEYDVMIVSIFFLCFGYQGFKVYMKCFSFGQCCVDMFVFDDSRSEVVYKGFMVFFFVAKMIEFFIVFYCRD